MSLSEKWLINGSFAFIYVQALASMSLGMFMKPVPEGQFEQVYVSMCLCVKKKSTCPPTVEYSTYKTKVIFSHNFCFLWVNLPPENHTYQNGKSKNHNQQRRHDCRVL